MEREMQHGNDRDGTMVIGRQEEKKRKGKEYCKRRSRWKGLNKEGIYKDNGEG